MKNKIFIAVILTAFVTLIATYGGYHMIKATGEYPFCGSCHEWDGAIAQTNLVDPIHGAANKRGLGAKCSDCHLPHDSLANYIFSKVKNGIAEGWTTMIGDPSKKDWIANREHARANYTFDSSCIKCHSSITQKIDANTTIAAEKMHLKYIEFKNTSDELKCTSCHKNVGHYELGKMLVEQKYKVADSWDEWIKMNK
ncbi:NapC/NirT family cytochrome c [Campylobacter sp. faydin G-140]|uniref:cytochrome c3 family protein n=1 Tax=Campylobacter anatolicus TaxID=2829105 RepID=UPI001B99C088|nr:NapC/NirT family cytochrome c [Campylobacter anatolicus]MBR8465979.1 NapC/NirT family cytochrome c [Campylobacter anatolicus]